MNTITTKRLRTAASWLTMFLFIVLAVHFYRFSKPYEERITYSKLYEEVEKGNIKTFTQSSKRASGEFVAVVSLSIEGRNVQVKHFTVALPVEDKDLIQLIHDKNPSAVIDGVEQGVNWLPFIFSFAPVLFLAAWLSRVSRQVRELRGLCKS